MIKNLVFDYGGVIVNLYDEDARRALTDLGISPLRQLLHHRRIRRLVHQFIDGLVPTEVTLKQMLRLCRKGTTRDDLLQVLGKLAGNLPVERLHRLCKLRGEYKVYMLSNINDVLWDLTEKQFRQLGFQLEDCFDAVFLSYRMKLAKPDRRIYEEFLKATGINPGESLYFDDRRDNVEAGRKCGFQAVWVRTNHLEEVLNDLL